ncbi:GtrA family protein [Parapedobacter sp. 10938]|uniref:GtrA family protein n=1 Tax=Parapedobacter flavus TaxID=3110225 RepID=UPI002DBB552E|nr:GtrA family protein [Parapedobacter sp. 10938]MEC3882097.1 GtrA family protein [Parapedobacter sp. 10938]
MIGIQKIIKYYLSGLACFSLDFAVTWMCYSILLVNPYIAHGIGWLLSTGCSFQLNRMWVFGDRDDARGKFTIFIALALLAVVISTVLLHVLHRIAGLDFYLAKFIAMGMVSVMNYVLVSRFIFDRRDDP